MAKSRKAAIKKKFSVLTNEFLVVRSSLGLILISAGVIFLAPLREEGDVSKLLLTLIYGIVLVLWLALIGELLMKTMRLLESQKTNKFAVILTINSLFGLFMPIFIGRVLMNKVIYEFLGGMTKADTIFCEIRSEIISYYRIFQVDHILSNLGFWVLVICITLFMWGSLIEKIWAKK